MSALKRTGHVLSAAIKALFALLMVGIMLATAVLDKRVNNPYPNTVPLANAIYYLFAALLLVLLWRACYGGKRRMRARTYYCALAALALIVAVLQYFISLWVPYNAFVENGDFGSISNGAWALANGEPLKYLSKFRMNPNNLNITFVVSWVYALIRRPRFAVWVGALLTNASMVLTSLSVYNVTKHEKTALATAILGELLVALSWRAFLVYTDNYGMIFVALVLWLYTTRLRPTVKVPLMLLSAAAGIYIKQTNLVLIAVLAAGALVKWLCADDHRIAVRRALLYSVCFVVILGGLFAGQNVIRRHYGFTPGKYPKNWQFMFMVGQNSETLGTAGGDNGVVRMQFIEEYGNLKDVSRACLDRALQSIRERGLWGNAVFYMKKLNVAYNDGYFHSVQSKKMADMDRTFLYSVYIHDGDYYQIPATLFQILWDAVLLTLFLYALAVALWALTRRMGRGRLLRALDALEWDERSRDAMRFVMIAALAITAYLMCLEGRSKYLFMFLPIYITAFGVMFHALAGVIDGMRKGN